MRYGKVYYYDRMGNRLRNGAMPDFREESSSISFLNPQRANIKLTSKRSLLKDGGYTSGKDVGGALHPDYPFKPNFLATEIDSELDFSDLAITRIMPDSPQIAEHSSTKFQTPLDDMVASEYQQMPKSIAPIISPLNSLQSPHNNLTDDMEQEQLQKELARMNLTINKNTEVGEWNTSNINTTQQYNNEYDDNDGSLCSRCRAEEFSTTHIAYDEQAKLDLKRKLADHVDEVNSNLSYKNVIIDKNRYNENLAGTSNFNNNVINFGMSNEVEEREKERLKREQYREELAAEIEQRRLANIRREEAEKQLENAANMRDAQKFAHEKEHTENLKMVVEKQHHAELRDQIQLRDWTKKEEELRPEWWERRAPYETRIMATDSAITAASEDLLLREQLRRNEALRENVEMLEDFKRQQKDSEAEIREGQKRQFDFLRDTIGEQTALIKGGGKRSLSQPTDPNVYHAWEEAHRQNDIRYQVLQDGDFMAGMRHKQYATTQKCCRKCHKPLKKYRKASFAFS